jgi:hypothetical protein
MRVVLLTLLLSMLVLVIPARTSAQSGHHACDASTIAALRTCVGHAADMGHIDNPGIARSLLATLNAAQAAYDRGQPAVAINQLHASIHKVVAQAGKHIEADHAHHMHHHAEAVIAALEAEAAHE